MDSNNYEPKYGLLFDKVTQVTSSPRCNSQLAPKNVTAFLAQTPKLCCCGDWALSAMTMAAAFRRPSSFSLVV